MEKPGLAHYGISDDGSETLSICICVIECYSESEQEDPEIAVESAPSLSLLVCTDVITQLFIDQMHGCHSFQLRRNYLDG